MIIDAWTYSFLLEEIKSELFANDQQPFLTQIKVVDSFSFVFIFMTGNGVKKLLIDTRYYLQCIFIMDKGNNVQKAKISRKAEHIKMTMRKHIKNHKLSELYQYSDERLFVFDFEEKQLILELMGQNYNLALCDSDYKVLSCLRTSDNVYPAKQYIFPEKNEKADFSDLEFLRTSKSVYNKTRKILQKEVRIPHVSSYLTINDKEQKILSPIKLDESSENYLGFNDILNKYYQDEKTELLKERILNRTEKEIQNDIKIIEEKIKKIPTAEESQKKLLKYKESGELLKTNYHLLKEQKGKEEITVFDYNKNAEVKIRIWPNLRPDKIIQKYFELYKKEKRAMKHNQKRIIELEREKESLMEELENLNEENISIPQGVQKNKKEERFPGKIKKHTIDDTSVYVGGSAGDNDYILSHIAKGRFMWLHAQKVKGAHVVIARPFGEISPELLEKAAKLAAKNSKYSKKKAIPVDYTHVKYVNKVKGVKGKVTFTQNKTIYVNI